MYRKFFMFLLISAVLAVTVAPAAAQTGDPADVANSFYGWYLGYAGYDEESGEFRNPLADGAYKERPELSPALIADIEALRDEQGGFHYDPFLCAQDVPGSFELSPIAGLSEGNAAVLVTTYFGFNPRPHNFQVSLSEQPDGGWLISDVNCQETVTPRGVTEAFYAWYLEQVPPAPEGDYPYLTAELNARLQETEPALGGGDPVLCAQDVPSYVAVQPVRVGQDEAVMLARERYAGNPDMRPLTVRLVYDEEWLIADIVCELAPETVAELLYNEYAISMRYDMRNDITRTPMADWGVYPWANYIDDTLLADLLETYRSEELLPADPFLCAQDLPEWVTAEPLDDAIDGRVDLQIMGAFPSGPDSVDTHMLTQVSMEQTESGQWQLVELACAQ